MAYDGKRIIPAGLLTINKQYEISGDKTKIGSNFTITVNGILMAFKGSPDSAGDFYTGSKYDPDARDEPTFLEDLSENERLGAIIRKQEALRELFSEEGKEFYIQSFDGTAPLKWRPTNITVSFQEGRWFNVCPYTITMETDLMSVNGELDGEDSFEHAISSAEETWAIETLEDTDFEGQNTYRLVHTIRATGKRVYDENGLVKESWEQAKAYVQTRLGYDSSKVTSSIILPVNSFNRYNRVLSETVDELGGSYSVDEAWVLADSSATETFEVTTERADGDTRVTINGTVNGLSVGDDLDGSKINNAESHFNSIQSSLKSRAELYSGETLNANPLSFNTSKNIVGGVIGYNYQYSNSTNQFADALSEIIEVTRSDSVDAFASIFVLGRTRGPVLQDLGTHQLKTVRLSISCVFPTTTVSYSNPLTTTYLSTLNNILDDVRPTGEGGVYISNRDDNWNPKTGSASFNIEWSYD